MKTIPQALLELDTKNDEQWTADGEPIVQVVADLVGRPVSRNDIINAAPKFTRHIPTVPEGTKPFKTAEPERTKLDLSEPIDDREAISADKVREFDMKLAKLDEAIARLKAERDDVTDQRNTYVTRVVEPYNHETDQARRMRFIRKQHETAIARATAAGTNSKSPLDKAFERTTQRPAPGRGQSGDRPTLQEVRGANAIQRPGGLIGGR